MSGTVASLNVCDLPFSSEYVSYGGHGVQNGRLFTDKDVIYIPWTERDPSKALLQC